MAPDPDAGAAGPDDTVNADPATDVSADEVTQFDEFLDDAPASAAGSRPVVDTSADDGVAADGTSAGRGSRDAGDSGADAELGADAEHGTDAEDPRVAELIAERDEYKDIAQRVQAEFENFRKQSVVRQTAEVERATGAFAEALLPVLDAAEAAYVAHPDAVGPLFNLLLGELRKRGLEPMELLDQPFDPNLADAVAHEAGDGGETRVAEVLRSGYTWKGKTLRAAMVRTAD